MHTLSNLTSISRYSNPQLIKMREFNGYHGNQINLWTASDVDSWKWYVLFFNIVLSTTSWNYIFHGRVASVDDLVRRVVFVETNRKILLL